MLFEDEILYGLAGYLQCLLLVYPKLKGKNFESEMAVIEELVEICCMQLVK